MPVQAGGSGYSAAIGSAKASFFDSNAILKLMDRTTAKALSKYGAFVRQRARTSIRYRKKSAPAGSPPSAHRSMKRTKTNRKGETKTQQVSPLRDLLYFSYDREAKSVIIGPVLADQSKGPHRRPKSGTVPKTLEEGGPITVQEILRRGKWSRIDLFTRRQIAGLPSRMRTERIGKHPFMAPADAAERPKLMGFFKENAL